MHWPKSPPTRHVETPAWEIPHLGPQAFEMVSAKEVGPSVHLSRWRFFAPDPIHLVRSPIRYSGNMQMFLCPKRTDRKKLPKTTSVLNLALLRIGNIEKRSSKAAFCPFAGNPSSGVCLPSFQKKEDLELNESMHWP